MAPVEVFAKNEVNIPSELDEYDETTFNQRDQGCFRIMSPKDGDRRVVWRRHNISSVLGAKKLFAELVEQGMRPFRVGTDGKATSQRMEDFDPIAEEVIFLPVAAIAGG